MIYTVNEIPFDEIFSEDNLCFIDSEGGVVEVQLSGDPAYFENGLLNLEIYDSDFNIWHVSFVMCTGFHEKCSYLQIDDKLLIMSSS